MRGLPRNWYNETWFRAQSDPQKALLNPVSLQPIPSLVSPIHLIYLHTICAQWTTLATLPGIYTLTALLFLYLLVGHLAGHLVGR